MSKIKVGDKVLVNWTAWTEYRVAETQHPSNRERVRHNCEHKYECWYDMHYIVNKIMEDGRIGIVTEDHQSGMIILAEFLHKAEVGCDVPD